MDVEYVICVIGMVLILEGLPYAAFPHRIKDWLRQVMEVPESTLRILGFIAMAAGLILVAWGRT